MFSVTVLLRINVLGNACTGIGESISDVTMYETSDYP
jgi:hypothetical protein